MMLSEFAAERDFDFDLGEGEVVLDMVLVYRYATTTDDGLRASGRVGIAMESHTDDVVAQGLLDSASHIAMRGWERTEGH